MVDVLSGQINGMFVDLPVISPYVKAGKVRALAVTSAKRSRYFPGVPTTAEAGYPDVAMTNCYGLLLPAKTPHKIVMKLYDAVAKAVDTPAVRDKLTAIGADPLTMTPDAFTKFLRSDIAKWGALVHSIGLQLDR